MAATYVETWGVFLGFVRPMMGGLLAQPHGGTLGWTWGYGGPVAALEEIRQEKQAGTK